MMGDGLRSPTLTEVAAQVKIESSPHTAALMTAVPTTTPLTLEEGETDASKLALQSLISSPSSPPSLIADSPIPLPGGEAHRVAPEASSVHNDLVIANRDYATLKEQHSELTQQHQDLRNICSAYEEVIQGLRVHQDPFPSIDQLRAEAGYGGFRAKALEADALNPVVCQAGGVQALISFLQSVRPLVEQAGGTDELRDLILEAHLLRIGVDAVGGLHALYNLRHELAALKIKKNEHDQLLEKVNGPNGLISRAQKFDHLVGSFHNIKKESINTDQWHRKHIKTVQAGTVLPDQTPTALQLSTEGLTLINPARASMMSAASLRDDPNRDLYEATPLVSQKKGFTRTGSNKVPLGRVLSQTQGNDVAQADLSRKRSQQDESMLNSSKRSRIDVERAAALIQTSLITRSPSGNEKVDKTPHAKMSTTLAPPLPRSLMTGMVVPNQSMSLPAISPVTNASNLSTTRTSQVRHYPIAAWTGSSNMPITCSTNELKLGAKLPAELSHFLAISLTKFINTENADAWNSIPINDNTCILRYLLDGHRPSGEAQERRSCFICSSEWGGISRPCALLLAVSGVPTVVFLPLHDTQRVGVRWTEKKFWIRNAQ
ncbi:hypothetical protein ACN47E_003708 [Coniothyrium glycines]